MDFCPARADVGLRCSPYNTHAEVVRTASVGRPEGRATCSYAAPSVRRSILHDRGIDGVSVLRAN